MSRASVLALVALGAAATALPAFAQEAPADRYGPPAAGYSRPFPAAYQQGYQPSGAPPSAAPAALRGRMLNWPGKHDRAETPAAYAVQAYAPPASPRTYAPPPSSWRNEASANAPLAYAPRIYPGSALGREPYADQPYAQQAPSARVAFAPQPYGGADPAAAVPSERRAYAPAREGWRPVFADAASTSPPAPAPSAPPALAGPPAAIYPPTSTAEMTPAQRAAAAPPPLRTASAAQRYGYDPSQGHQVRFYSVHRAFGLQPDAAPIPPQFFTASADLSEPPGPLPTDRTTTTTTASGTRVSHAAPDTSPN